MSGRAISLGALLTAGLIVLPVAAWATPCTGDYMQTPVPGAADVQTRHQDVPSPRAISLWQEGQLDGFRYVASADLTARITPPNDTTDWAVVLTCDEAAQTCARTQRGTPPEAADRVADRLELCLLGQPLTPIEEEDRVPEIAIAPPPSVDEIPLPAPATEPVPECLPDTTAPEPTPVHALQRLLNANGLEAGPVDGIVGPRTRAALAQIVPEMANGTLFAQSALDAATAALCPTE